MHGADHWRVVGIVPPDMRGRDDLSFDQVFPALREELGADLVLRKCSWFSTYRIHHRRAARFRDRRCFLLGDAAHIHSPVGAQGMNTGLQDAYNLAWKLALVVAGRASPALLDSYEAERIPVAERLLSTTDRGFSLIVSDSLVVGTAPHQGAAEARGVRHALEQVQQFAFMTISQTGIEYRRERAVEDAGGLARTAPAGGRPFPLAASGAAAHGVPKTCCLDR